jgi:hypothetical protein
VISMKWERKAGSSVLVTTRLGRAFRAVSAGPLPELRALSAVQLARGPPVRSRPRRATRGSGCLQLSRVPSVDHAAGSVTRCGCRAQQPSSPVA